MTFALRAHGSIQRTLAITPTTSLWITDALLAEAFCRFTCTHRRHGSTTPGPLEARKRTAKRKTTSLATIESPPDVPDPFTLFENKSGVRPWLQPSERKKREKTRYNSYLDDGQDRTSQFPDILPWWKTKPPEDTDQTLRPETWIGDFFDAATSERKPDVQEPREQDKLHNILPQLEACLTVSDVEFMIQQAHIDLRHHPDLCDDLVRHLLENTKNHALLADLISHPSLNPPGSHNARTIYSYLSMPALLESTQQLYYAAVSRASQLGLLPTEDFVELVSITLRTTNATPDAALQERKLRSVLEWLYALESSAVSKPQDIPSHQFNHWWRQVASISSSRLARRLCSRFTFYAPPQPHGDLVQITLQHFGRICAALSDNPSLNQKQLCLALAELLIRTNTDSLRKSLPHITEELVERVLTRNMSKDVMVLWYTVLGLIPGEIGKEIRPDGPMWMDFRDSRPSTINPTLRPLVYCWTAVATSHRYLLLKPLLNGTNLGWIMRSTFDVDFNPSNEELVQKIYDLLLILGLLQSERVLYGLRNLYYKATFDVVRTIDEAVVLDMKTVEIMAKFSDHIYFAYGEQADPKLFRGISETVNRDIKKFRNIARKLITTEPEGMRIVHRILKHNLTFQLAVREAGLAEIERSLPSTGPRESNSLLETRKLPNELYLEPQTALDVLHYIAAAYATSPILSNRASLRYVYWCYCYLQRYGGPIQPPITRAMWHAGVTRQGRKGTNTTFLRYVLQKVREVEGVEVARSLLFNSAFRDRRDLAMEVFRDSFGVPISSGQRGADKAWDKELIGKALDLEKEVNRDMVGQLTAKERVEFGVMIYDE